MYVLWNTLGSEYPQSMPILKYSKLAISSSVISRMVIFWKYSPPVPVTMPRYMCLYCTGFICCMMRISFSAFEPSHFLGIVRYVDLWVRRLGFSFPSFASRFIQSKFDFGGLYVSIVMYSISPSSSQLSPLTSSSSAPPRRRDETAWSISSMSLNCLASSNHAIDM